MPRIVIEWDAGEASFDIDYPEYGDFVESGESAEMYFDTYVSDVWPEKYVRIVD